MEGIGGDMEEVILMGEQWLTRAVLWGKLLFEAESAPSVSPLQTQEIKANYSSPLFPHIWLPLIGVPSFNILHSLSSGSQS